MAITSDRETLDLLESCTDPRKRQFLSQALRNHTASYADLTAQDAKASPDLEQAKGVVVEFTAAARLLLESGVPGDPRPGLIQR